MSKSVKPIKSAYVQKNIGGIISKISLYARQRMFRSLMEIAQPTSETSVLDVGVTCDRRQDSNFFEKLYLYPQQITAVGVEEAYFLEQDFPGLKYVKADGLSLPFPDQSFDLVVSFAVIEHVGDRRNQQKLIAELCRVGRNCYITTPNRWYPIEFHTVLPLIHWLPAKWFRWILKFLGQEFWSKEENLNLLTLNELFSFFPSTTTIKNRSTKLFGITSNLCLYVQNHTS
ncbi:MAG: class I SAM-dependent methyltransferase [Aphanocapsa sp. GSE-SYN-MK-11-07L]|jgi:SAM-dependent methyltransferase|nr:class I SAM-dependent methyltransferase [Aphanocapsa sp. GSE-SYN-MK-11-07L]